MKTTVFFLILIFTTCNAQKNSGDIAKKDHQGNDDGLILMVSDPYSGIEVAETLIIKDAKSLQKFYSQINRTRKPGLPVPDIDFSEEIVVIRCSGATDKGAMPHLFIMEETEDELVLGTKETDNDSRSTAVTTPFSAYRMPLTKKEVIVREEY
ncbi:hypothetical protein [Pricia sp.]|uniref:hypothetical protein n=1 Tax=Pricia sp. TaxID=2268138 RepID=UPI0035947887